MSSSNLSTSINNNITCTMEYGIKDTLESAILSIVAVLHIGLKYEHLGP